MLSLPHLGRVHDQYLALGQLADQQFSGSLKGKLLLRTGFDPAGVAAIIGASIAGAASLCVDGESERLRDGLRSGLCDFVVSHLDEAVRILKNELRRERAVSVCLTAAPTSCLEEMLERGLQPDLLSLTDDFMPQGRIFTERGAVLLPESTSPPRTSLYLWTMPAANLRAGARISRLAAAALDPARPDTAARQRWLDTSPRYLGRAFGSRQCLRMSEAEAAAFRAGTLAEFPAFAISKDG